VPYALSYAKLGYKLAYSSCVTNEESTCLGAADEFGKAQGESGLPDATTSKADFA